MLRAIADIARHHGEDLSTLEARLACVEVFALGASGGTRRTDVGYYASRALINRIAADATGIFLERGVANLSAPVVSSLVTEIAARFGIVVSERSAASALPVLGAVGGATVNVIFMNHFQRVARGHFAIRRLERQYGPSVVRQLYNTHATSRRSDREVNSFPMDAKASAVSGTGIPATPPPANPAIDPRLAGLRRMRLIATLLLVAMTIVFIATSVVKLDWPWIPYLRAFSEAAMVGACADWFAIVALFRRPFGLPIPHTGIVPNNKDRIGGALGRFITNNFLTASAMNERLARIDVLGSLGRWISEPSNAKRLGEYAAVLLPRVASSLPAQQLGESVGNLARQALETIPAAPVASGLLRIIWAHGEAQALIAQLIEYSETWLNENKDYLTRKISQQSSGWIPKWIDKMIAEKVLNGVLSTLGEMRNPRHPWRIEMRKGVQRLIDDLATDPQMRARAEGIKAELLASPLLMQQAKTLWTEIESGLNSALPANSETIAQTCEQGLRSIGAWLLEDEERKASLNGRVLAVTQQFLLLYRFEIGGYIERVVHDWDTTTLVDRLELQVGKDLQYIRINGTLVGGLVGLLIFIASKWLAML